MTVLNTANALYFGDQIVDGVYAGENKVWPAGSWGPDESMWDDATSITLNPGGYTLGAKFNVRSHGRITHIRFFSGYRDGVDNTSDLHVLSIWNAGGNKLYTTTVVTFGFGWHSIELETPLVVVPDTYVVSRFEAVNYPYIETPDYTLDSPNLSDPLPCYGAGATETFPNSVAGIVPGTFYMLDVIYQEMVPQPEFPYPYTPPEGGLTVWLEPEDYTGWAWPNRGSAPFPTVVGSPIMAVLPNAPSGDLVVRFTRNEARLRGTEMIVNGAYDLTWIYVGRIWAGVGGPGGVTFGRPVGNVITSSPYNFLVGILGNDDETMYDNGFVAGGAYVEGPTPWKIYEGVCSGSPIKSDFYVNGVLKGTHSASIGHDSRWAISGHGAEDAGDTSNFECASMFIYDRVLSPEERQEIRDYLIEKYDL